MRTSSSFERTAEANCDVTESSEPRGDRDGAKDDLPPVAAVNRRYVDPQVSLGGRVWRWCLRLVGQARRQYLSRLRPHYVERMRDERRGACRCCAACCHLTFHCPFLRGDRCTHYEKRTRTCRDFPIDARDLRLTQVPCGFWFETEPARERRIRVPLTPYGAKEITVTLLVAVIGGGVAWFYWPGITVLLLVVLVGVLYFYRDPERTVPQQAGVVVAPADGRVTELVEVDESEFLHERCIKIGIFMSPLSVHVNRAPAGGTVERVVGRPGRFLSALSPKATDENERVSMVLGSVEGTTHRLLVRQIAGVLARRIVCDAWQGKPLLRGQRFGMIKAGSRTEIFVPVGSGFRVEAQLDQKVHGGETVLGRLT